MEFVGVYVFAEDLARSLPVFAQQRCAGEADKDCVLHPSLHLSVHVATLGAVAFIHENIKPPVLEQNHEADQ